MRPARYEALTRSRQVGSSWQVSQIEDCMEEMVRQAVQAVSGVRFTEEEIQRLVDEIVALLRLFRQMDRLDLTGVEPVAMFTRERFL